MNRFDKIREKLDMYDLDAVMLTEEVNRFYATGFHSMGTDGIALVTKNGNYYFTDSRYEVAVKEELHGAEIFIPDDRNYIKPISEIILAEGIKHLGIDDEFMSLNSYLRYKESLPCTLVEASKMMAAIRLVKDEDEKACLIQAQRISERALTEVLNDMKAGATEKEISARLIYLMHLYGADQVTLTPGVVSGANGAKPHGEPSFKPFENGEFVTIDFGCVYHGYYSDMTRTYGIGYVTDEMAEVYDIVLKAHLAGIEGTRAGVSAKSVDAIARDYIRDAGYGDCFGHGYGHGIGLQVHEEPFLSPRSDDSLLVAGCFTSAEPGIYLPGRFGIRIEDVVEIKETCAESIARMPKELTILGKG